MTGDDVEAVLVTGVYGAGKSTVVADIGGMLERRGERIGIVDVDFRTCRRCAKRLSTGAYDDSRCRGRPQPTRSNGSR